MMIEVNRFLTLDEIRAAYGLPDPLACKILPLLSFAVVLDDGTRLYLESEVDEILVEFVRTLRLDDGRAEPPASGRQGRKIETQEIAVYANDLRRKGITWKKVFKSCQERWPNDDRVGNVEQVRATWTRFFGRNRRGAN